MQDATDVPDDALMDRLRIIEEQPLADRPTSYAALHDELSRALQAPGTGSPGL